MTKPFFQEPRSMLFVYILVYFYVSQRCFCLVKLTRKSDAASNFVVPQLTEQDSGPYDKSHLGYVRRDKIVLTWERISHGIHLCSLMFQLKLLMESIYRVGQFTQREAEKFFCLKECAVKIFRILNNYQIC
jgi:hypothetical protein